MALFDTNAFRISEQGLSVLWQKQQGELAKAQIQYDAIMNSMNGNFARVRSAMTTK